MYKLAAYTGVPLILSLVHRSTLLVLLQLVATMSTKDLICQACEKDENKTKKATRRYNLAIYSNSELQLMMIFSSINPCAQCIRMNTIIRSATGALMIYLSWFLLSMIAFLFSQEISCNNLLTTSDKAQILRPLVDFATNMTNLAEVQKTSRDRGETKERKRTYILKKKAKTAENMNG